MNFDGRQVKTLPVSQTDQPLHRAGWTKPDIKEVDDGIWLASFMHYDLGYFDLEQKTPQPLDNPFGTSCHRCLRYVLLPMCPGWTW
jgi:hypothetical protein